MINNLKEAKAQYLKGKQNNQQLHNEFALNNSKRKALKVQRFREKEKMKWYRLKRVFDKRRLKSIKAIEYIQDHERE